MAISKKQAFLIMNLAIAGYGFYYYLKGIAVARLAVVIAFSALILNLMCIYVLRTGNKKNVGEHGSKDS